MNPCLGLNSRNAADGDLGQLLGRRPRVVIGHPYIGRGGSESGVMWIAEALKADCDVTVVTLGGWQLDELNEYYGTTLKPEEVTVRLAPAPLISRKAVPDALRGAFYQRFARRIAAEYDVRISKYNPTDWGVPAIHFISDFTWHREIWETYTPRTPGWFYKDTLLRRAYLSFVRAYASPSGRDLVRADRLVANSQWSAALVKQYCGVPHLPVIYPPVWASFPRVSWQEKEDAFVMIGRIASEKRIEAAIRVLGSLRGRGHRLILHLCGEIPQDSYGRMITELCASNHEWITCHGRVSGSLKSNLLARAKYGIHTCAHEAFGISVAEMVKAGAIVFAPSLGGQAEILDHPDLLFADEEEAIRKIQAVLEQPELQTQLRAHLEDRAKLFSAQRFMREVRAYISDAVNADKAAASRH